MKKELTFDQVTRAKSWLHDLFALAGESAPMKDPGYGHMYGDPMIAAITKTDAKAIVNEIKLRKFTNLDDEFDKLARCKFGTKVSDASEVTKVGAQELAYYVAWFCDKYKIYWDNTTYTPEEINIFKDTFLGKAVTAFDLFVTSTAPKATPARTTGTSSTRTASTRTGAPKDDYKSSGPQSGNVRDLIGTPGDKTKISGEIYFIIADPIGSSSTPMAAYIRPLEAVGADGSTNKVYVASSWKSYRNCICFFDTEGEAKSYMAKLLKTGRYPETMKVVMKHCDKNGYFKVGTSFGQVLVQASKLNECLSETVEVTKPAEDLELEEAVKKYMSVPLGEEVYEMTDNIKDIRSFHDAYTHYDN